MASARAEALGDKFDKAVQELIDTVEGCSDTQWKAVCGDEGWTVAAAAHHVGSQWPLEREYLDAISAGEKLPGYSMDDINTRNEKHAKEFSNCSKETVLMVLRNDSKGMASFVRGLSDEQLDAKGELPLAGGATVTTEQLIAGGVLIDHAVAHTKSIRAVG